MGTTGHHRNFPGRRWRTSAVRDFFVSFDSLGGCSHVQLQPSWRQLGAQGIPTQQGLQICWIHRQGWWWIDLQQPQEHKLKGDVKVQGPNIFGDLWKSGFCQSTLFRALTPFLECCYGPCILTRRTKLEKWCQRDFIGAGASQQAVSGRKGDENISRERGVVTLR